MDYLLVIIFIIIFLIAGYLGSKQDEEQYRKLKKENKEYSEKLFRKTNTKKGKFYKMKTGGVVNLDEIVIISPFNELKRECYSIRFKGQVEKPGIIEKEDYEGIIKHLEIVNVDTGTYVYCNGGRTKIKLDSKGEDK